MIRLSVHEVSDRRPVTTYACTRQRDPSAPVRVGKARVVCVLLERLASLPPSDAYCPSSEGPGGRRLLYFRWLAQYLGPVPATSDERR